MNHTYHIAKFIEPGHYVYKGFSIIAEDHEWFVYDTPEFWPIQSDDELTLGNCKRYIDKNLGEK